MQRELDYLYVSGSIKVKETKLLAAEDYDKLIAAPSTAEFLKILAAHGYDTACADADAPHFADALVASERRALFAMLEKDAPNSAFFNFFLYQNDYLNAKVLLKRAVSGGEGGTLSGEGVFPTDDIRRAVNGEEVEGLTPLLKEGIVKAKESYGKTADPQNIDIVLDRFCFADMSALAAESGEEFLKDYVSLVIDAANVKAYFRLKKMGRNADFAKTVFADGGSVAADFFTENYDLSFEDFAAKARHTSIASLAALATEHIEAFGGRGKIELAFDDRVMEFVRRARYMPYGAAVVAAYVIAKETEFKNIRIISAAKASGVDKAGIKERLRRGYV